MTSRERVLTALAGGKPDAVPFFDNVNRAARRMIMQTDDYTDREFEKVMRFDALDFYGFTPPFAATNVKGALTGGLIATRDDLRALRLPELTDEYLAQGRRFVDEYADTGMALFFRTRFGPSYIVQSMGFETFSLALYDDPSLVEEFADLFADWVLRLLEKVRDMGFDFAWFADDIAFKTSLIFSPQVFREVFLPRMRRISAAWPGLWAYHSDGNLMEVLDDLVSLGMNALNPIEPGAMDIEEIRVKYGPKLCLIGNVNMHETLVSGTIREVWEEVRSRIETVGKDGGYVIASSNSITYYCKRENVFAMIDAIGHYRDYGVIRS